MLVLVLTTSQCNGGKNSLSAGRTAYFFSAGFSISVSAINDHFMNANHQPALPSNSYFVRSRITLINANIDQDHFQEHQIQIFTAASNTVSN